MNAIRSPYLALIIGLACSAAGAEDSVEKLSSAYLSDLGDAQKSIASLELRYGEELEKLKVIEQEKGELENVLMIQKEIETFKKLGDRDFREVPALLRLRGIYESGMRRLEGEVNGKMRRVMQNYIERSISLKRQLTKEGNLKGALKAEELSKEIATELSELLDSMAGGSGNLVWELDDANSFQLVRDCVAEKDGRIWKLTSPHTHASYLDSDETFDVPFVIKMRAGTNSTGIRFYFAGGEIVIFNWKDNPDQLRVKSPRASRAVGFNDQGRLAKDILHDIEIQILENKISVSANDELRGELDGSFSDLSGSVGIGPAFGSEISIERFEIHKSK